MQRCFKEQGITRFQEEPRRYTWTVGLEMAVALSSTFIELQLCFNPSLVTALMQI